MSAMSAIGTKRTWPDVCYESVMCTKADIAGSGLFGPAQPAERRLIRPASTLEQQTAAWRGSLIPSDAPPARSLRMRRLLVSAAFLRRA
jgi:hypothetical protein